MISMGFGTSTGTRNIPGGRHPVQSLGPPVQFFVSNAPARSTPSRDGAGSEREETAALNAGPAFRKRRCRSISAVGPVLLAAALAAACGPLARPPEPADDGGFPLEETTIAAVHDAMEAGELTAGELVDRYLERIEAYDKRGPALNAVLRVNPRARERASELDAAMASSGRVGPLHGIPMLVKDNYDTADIPTSAGSASLADSVPPDDATQVRQIRAAGAIVLAKTNMAEFAFSPYETIGSALPGYTRNPYATNRVPAGSSGGTAAGVAANFAVLGLGTDTGNSIRGPSSHTALVGIRSTLGLTSRDGIVPLYFSHDVGGPMARTVEDAARVLTVLAGTDPADPYTEEADVHAAVDYTEFLDADGLQGARIGVVRQISDQESGDPRVLERFEAALGELRAGGAEVVDVVIPLLDERIRFWCARFRYDLNGYLATLGPGAPVTSLQEIVDSGEFHHSVRSRLRGALDEESGDPAERCAPARDNRRRLREQVREVLAAEALEALVFPTWSNLPRLIGDLASPAGDNSQILSPQTGFPAITVPMGWVQVLDVELPVGLQILGNAWAEPTLIRLAYAYEQRTRHRRPPATTPPRR